MVESVQVPLEADQAAADAAAYREIEEKKTKKLLDKIKSKMDVAKLLGTFLTGVLTAIIGLATDTKRMEYVLSGKECKLCFISTHSFYPLPDFIFSFLFLVSVMLIVFSIIMFFGTMYAYDRLLMPGDYWIWPSYSSSTLFSE